MKIRINDIEKGQALFVLVADDGTETRELRVLTTYFEDIRKMVSLNLSFESAQQAPELNIAEKNRLKRLGEQLAG